MANNKSLAVVSVDRESIKFENGIELMSAHDQDCCEHHWLEFSELSIDDFAGLRFDLSGDEFFNRVPDYGIELIPTSGYPVRIAGHASNNGYYSSNLSLVLIDKQNKSKREYNITECQKNDY